MNRTELQCRLTSYLRIREALGMPVGSDSKVLVNFIDFAGAEESSEAVTSKLVFDWLDSTTEQRLGDATKRLSLVRQFLLHLSAAFPDTQVPEVRLLCSRKRPTPFVFSPEEIEQLLQGTAEIDSRRLLSLEELNERLWRWIENAYHCSEHSALGTTPMLRWQRDIEQVRQLPPATDLRRLFLHRADRFVRRDSTFLLRKRLYEAPPHLAGHTVEVRFDPLDTLQAEIWFQGQLEAVARLVDSVVNGQLPRAKPASTPPPEPTGINFVELLKANKDDDEE